MWVGSVGVRPVGWRVEGRSGGSSPLARRQPIDSPSHRGYHSYMAVLVVYENNRNREVAEAIAKATASHDVATLVLPADEITPAHIASASAVIAGCRTPGDVPFGGVSTQHVVTWIARLEPLDGKPIGVYCAYKFFPHTFADTTARVAKTLSKLSQMLELHGGKVVATQGINLKSIDDGAHELVERMLGDRDPSTSP